jgi:platelet-activating factor acetylhydrolase
MFYVKGSVHWSQSDFQLLFPYLTRRYFHAKVDAAEVMDLNVRAGLEFLRRVGVEGVMGDSDPIFDNGHGMDGWVELEREL